MLYSVALFASSWKSCQNSLKSELTGGSTGRLLVVKEKRVTTACQFSCEDGWIEAVVEVRK